MLRNQWQVTGFDGKLPSRGDFVSHALPRSFLTPWRAWIDAGLHASRVALGEAWVPAWLVAPVWHFALAPGVVGPDAVAGLFFPSVDRAGRHYPMMVAEVVAGLAGAPDLACAWREAAEAAALAALAQDHPPEWLAAALDGLAAHRGEAALAANAAWWMAEGPVFVRGDMPGAGEFAAMMGGEMATITNRR